MRLFALVGQVLHATTIDQDSAMLQVIDVCPLGVQDGLEVTSGNGIQFAPLSLLFARVAKYYARVTNRYACGLAMHVGLWTVLSCMITI